MPIDVIPIDSIYTPIERVNIKLKIPVLVRLQILIN